MFHKLSNHSYRHTYNSYTGLCTNEDVLVIVVFLSCPVMDDAVYVQTQGIIYGVMRKETFVVKGNRLIELRWLD